MIAVNTDCHQGAELDVALAASDYQVTVDDLPCPVVVLERTLLRCRVDSSLYIALQHAAVKVLRCSSVLSLAF